MRRRQTIPIEEHEACLRKLGEMLREARTAWCHEHEALIWEESGCDPYEEIRAVGGDEAVTDAIYHARWMNDDGDDA